MSFTFATEPPEYPASLEMFGTSAETSHMVTSALPYSNYSLIGREEAVITLAPLCFTH